MRLWEWVCLNPQPLNEASYRGRRGAAAAREVKGCCGQNLACCGRVWDSGQVILMPLVNNKVGNDGTVGTDKALADGKALVDSLMKVRCSRFLQFLLQWLLRTYSAVAKCCIGMFTTVISVCCFKIGQAGAGCHLTHFWKLNMGKQLSVSYAMLLHKSGKLSYKVFASPSSLYSFFENL